MAILIGILLGLSTLLFIGPVLFYLIKSTLESGKSAGIAVAVGIILGDIICVILALYGSQKYFDDFTNVRWIALAGGIILLSIGLKYVFKPSISTNIEPKLTKKLIVTYFLNGFIINFVNPFVFAVWFGFTAYLRTKFESNSDVVLGLVFILVVIFTTDILKTIFAERLNRLISPGLLPKLYKVFGVIMILFSLKLFYTAY